MLCEDKRAPTCEHAVWVHEYEVYVCSREDRGCDYREKLLYPEEQLKLFTKEFGNDRKEYRYGPEWVAMQLMLEGGYRTPEEAKLRWLEYGEGRK